MSETTLDSKGRVLIPENIRKKARLVGGSKVRVYIDNDIVMIRKRKDPHGFILENEGAIKKGSAVKMVDPIKLKKIPETKKR